MSKAELVQACEALADDHRGRAERIRARSTLLGDQLEPLRVAMRRRASELELTAAALDQIADGQRRWAA